MPFTVESLNNLAKDHEEIKKHAHTILGKKTAIAVRKNAVRDLLPLMKVHSQREEKVLYEYMNLMNPELKRLAHREVEEHSVFLRLIKELISVKLPPRAWTIKAKIFAEFIRHHINEEELDLFVKLNSAIKANGLTPTRTPPSNEIQNSLR